MKFNTGDIVRVGPFEYEVIAVDIDRLQYAIRMLHTRNVNIISVAESQMEYVCN